MSDNLRVSMPKDEYEALIDRNKELVEMIGANKRISIKYRTSPPFVKTSYETFLVKDGDEWDELISMVASSKDRIYELETSNYDLIKKVIELEKFKLRHERNIIRNAFKFVKKWLKKD